MSEPTGLNFIVILASAETNYPAGGNAWSGQPILVAPAADYDTPNTKPPAQTFNYRNNLLSKQDRRILNVAVTAAVSNFDSVLAKTTIAGTVTSVYNLFWQPYSQKWLALVTTSAPAGATYSSHDNGRTWKAEQSNSFSLITATIVAGAAVPPSVGQPWYLAAVGDSTHTLTFSFNDLGGTVAILAATCIVLPAALFPMGLTSFPNNGGGWGFVGVTQSGANYSGFFSSTPDSHANVAAFINGTSGLPAAWQAGTCNLYGLVSASTPAQTTLVVMCGKTPVTDVARTLLVSPTGGFTDHAPSFLSTTVATGAAYSAADSLWGVLCNDGANSYLYTSPDAATWTLTKEFVGMPISGGLTVIGNVWAAQVATASGSGDMRVMYSADVGADIASSQWGTANAYLTGTLNSSSMLGALASSGNGIAGWNGVSGNLHFSRQVGTMANGQV